MFSSSHWSFHKPEKSDRLFLAGRQVGAGHETSSTFSALLLCTNPLTPTLYPHTHTHSHLPCTPIPTPTQCKLELPHYLHTLPPSPLSSIHRTNCCTTYHSYLPLVHPPTHRAAASLLLCQWTESVCPVSCVPTCDTCGLWYADQGGQMQQLQRGNGR